MLISCLHCHIVITIFWIGYIYIFTSSLLTTVFLGWIGHISFSLLSAIKFFPIIGAIVFFHFQIQCNLSGRPQLLAIYFAIPL
jgi:hypothetical protein